MPEYLTGTSITTHIPSVETAEFVHKGGQKAVYKATMGGQAFALKVVALGSKRAVSEEQVAHMHATALVKNPWLDAKVAPLMQKSGRGVLLPDCPLILCMLLYSHE